MPSIRRPTTSDVRAGLLLCFLSQVLLNTADASSYTVNIEARDEECFYVSYPPGASMMFGNYDQVDGAPSGPFSLVVMDVDKERVLFKSLKGSRVGTFKVNLKEGQKASICLQNGLLAPGRREKPHDGLERVVGFQFVVEPKDEGIGLQVQNGRLLKSSQELMRELSTLKSRHDYQRVREAKHREIVESTFSRLLWWIILESLVLVGVAAGQVMYLRRFLEKRRYI
jgi:hypothetical protein